jgi:RimJ/RimL family protein N-acetyltransferase
MIYASKEIRIRPFTVNDQTKEYRSWFNDPEVTKYNSHGLFPYTAERAERFMEHITEGGRGDTIIWAIEVLEDNNNKPKDIRALHPDNLAKAKNPWIHIGNVSLQSINYLNRSGELAIVIGNKDAWGKGYGTTVCAMVLHHAFEKLGLNRVWTGTAKTNRGMNGICQRLDMVREGELREGMFLDGEFVGVQVYGILAEEYWAQKRVKPDHFIKDKGDSNGQEN